MLRAGVIERSVNQLIRIGAILTFVAMTLVFVAGILWMLLGSWLLIPFGGTAVSAVAAFVGYDMTGPHPDGVSLIFKGLEFVFIAPIIYLSFVSVCVFSKDRIRRIAEAVTDRVTHPPHNLSDPLMGIVLQIKSLVAGLMVAVLLTSLISRVLADVKYEPITLSAHVFATVLALGYYAVVDRHQT